MSQRESKYVNAIRRGLHARGWVVFKNHGTAYSGRGRPDLECFYRDRVLLIEVKVPGEEPTPIQKATVASLRRRGTPVVVASYLSEIEQTVWSIERSAGIS